MIAPETPNCDFCQSRHKMHLRNMAEIRELYTDDFNLNEIPLNPTEVRGITALRKFGRVIIH